MITTFTIYERRENGTVIHRKLTLLPFFRRQHLLENILKYA